MLRSLGSILLACVLFSPALSAQISRVPGTGCTGAYPTPSPASARIGTTVTINGARICPGRFPGMFVLGTAILAPIQPPITCQTCTLGALPIVFQTTLSIVTVPIPIPNDRGLIGVCFHVQTGCQSVQRCWTFDGALKICIQA